jgi:hypothetical protein
MNVKKTVMYTALASACVFGGNAQAAEILIDLFTEPAAGQDVSTADIGAANADTSQVGSYASVIGGWRDLSIHKLTDTWGLANQGDAAMAVGAGALTIDNATGVTSRAVITWDGNNDAGVDGLSVNTSGLSGFDLTLGGNINVFLADVLYADLGFDYEIRIWDMDGSQASLIAGVQIPVGTGNPGSIPSETADYLFDWFNLPAGNYCDGISAPPACTDPFTQLTFAITRGGNLGDIDFTNIGALQIEFTNTAAFASADFALGKIRAPVPEPGTLALLGLGLLGLGFSMRRKLAA